MINKEENKEYLEPVDHTIPDRDYSYTDDQEKLYNEFKDNMIRLMQPVVEDLVVYLRALEVSNPGSGKNEIEVMLGKKEINKMMYDVLMPSLDNLDKEYIVNLK